MASINLVSWNINGIRAAEKKGFREWLEKGEFEVAAVQETKAHHPDILSSSLLAPDGYASYWACAEEKKGYSGVAVYSKIPPKKVKTDFGDNLLSREGRMLELDFGNFVFINLYVPNGGSGTARLNYKLKFYDILLHYLKRLLKEDKKIIFCGDINTAHKEIDLARPKENANVSGFLPEEREWLDRFAEAGFADTFRMFHKEGGYYSWWDQKTMARDRDVGWRLDYFFVSDNFKKNVKDAFILKDIMGSDHAPVGVKIEI